MSIRILLADDHTIMQAGLCALIEKESDMKIIAEAVNGRETEKLSAGRLPHVVIMDISMPDLNGIRHGLTSLQH
ncbi:MAG: response regulator [Deltaproteobacteria bacterium]|nr:response regulator [Deltaproteobacteria bacterium]